MLRQPEAALRLQHHEPGAPLAQAACLHRRAGRHAHSVDVCGGTPVNGPTAIELTPVTLQEGSTRERILGARSYCDDVRSWRTQGGITVQGRGIARR
jgi:hypothetical protein